MFDFFKKQEDNNEVSEYTYDMYLNNIYEVQSNELNSSRFQNIKKFVDDYFVRKSINKEQILLKMLKNNHDFNYDNQYYIQKLKQIKRIINDCSVNEIESNIYLKSIKNAMYMGKIDCKNIIEKIANGKYETIEEVNRYQYLRVDIRIDKKSLNLLGDYVDTTCYIKNYLNNDSDSYDTVDILDENNIKYYLVYNSIIKSLNEINKTIYNYRLLKEIEKCNLNIKEMSIVFGEDLFENLSVYYLIEKQKKKYKKK